MAAEAGLRPDEVIWMRPADVWLTIEGYDLRMRGEWERTRMLGFWIHQHSMVDKKHKKNSPHKFCPLPWERVRKPKTSLAEKYERQQELIKLRRAQIEELERLKEKTDGNGAA